MNDTAKAKRRGRPPKPKGEVKRNQVNIAFADPVYKAIKEAAEANGRSVSSEIDFRLGLSLALERDAGDIDTRRLLDFARLASVSVRNTLGKPWTEEPIVASALLGALEVFIRGSSPPLPEADLLDEAEDEFGAIVLRAKAAVERQPPNVAEITQVVADFVSYATYRERVAGLERKRRLVGARMIRDVVHLITGTPPEGEHAPPEEALEQVEAITKGLAVRTWGDKSNKAPPRGRKHG